jgi:hypothetical protein
LPVEGQGFDFSKLSLAVVLRVAMALKARRRYQLTACAESLRTPSPLSRRADGLAVIVDPKSECDGVAQSLESREFLLDTAVWPRITASNWAWNGVAAAQEVSWPNGGATANDLGEYRMYGLAPGRYYLSATNRAGMMMLEMSSDGNFGVDANGEATSGMNHEGETPATLSRFSSEAIHGRNDKLASVRHTRLGPCEEPSQASKNRKHGGYYDQHCGDVAFGFP